LPKDLSLHRPIDFINDSPEIRTPLFGFDAYAQTIAALIANKENETPMVIGIYGAWGSGKTTLMQTVKRLLEQQKGEGPWRKCKTVWFQAWKYGKEEEILAALIEVIFKTMQKDGFINRCKSEFEKLASNAKPSAILSKLSKMLASGMDVTEFFADPVYKAKLGFLDTFQDFFDRLVWSYIDGRPKLLESQTPDDTQGALVIFIDDLDRCPRDKIVLVLETIKLFMDKKGCIFVIGAANAIIEKGLQETYGNDAARFMDKIVQVSFNLPPIAADDFKPFLEQTKLPINNDIEPHLPLLLPAMQHNPRQFKRFLNNVSLQQGLLQNNKIGVDVKLVLFWNIIDYLHPSLAKDIRDNPVNLEALRKQIEIVESNVEDQNRWDIPDKTLNEVPQSFKTFVQDKALVDIIRQFHCDSEELNQLITFSSVIESAGVKRDKSDLTATVKNDFDVMAVVPAGEFIFGKDKEKRTIEKPFEIDVYPVTNAQYAEFIKNGGYENDDYWSEAGKKRMKREKITQPKYCNDKKWNQADHPVVGVSNYEAEAYAKWANKRLPTEEEWERAARSDDGREYPWGNKFDKAKCNTGESGIGKTTRVTRYPNGINQVGCYDMSGNVWEWTTTEHENRRQVMRGGSWFDSGNDASCTTRYIDHKDYRGSVVGFRCVRTKN